MCLGISWDWNFTRALHPQNLDSYGTSPTTFLDSLRFLWKAIGSIFSSTKRFWWLDQPTTFPPMFVQGTVVRCRLRSIQNSHTLIVQLQFFLAYLGSVIPPLAAISFFFAIHALPNPYNSFVGHEHAWEIRIDTNFGELGAHQCQAYY